MLTKSLFFALLIVAFCNYTSVGQSVTYESNEISSSDSVDCRKITQELKIQINYLIAIRYCEICKANSLSPPIGNLGWEKVKMYWEAVPELQEGRDKFDNAYHKLTSYIEEKTRTDTVIKKISGRRENEGYNTWKMRINDELIKRYSSEYILLRQDYDDLLSVSNCQTLAYIIDDYSQEHLLFPIDWIPVYYVNKIRSDFSFITLENELKAIQKRCSAGTFH